ncbi:MAG TPA: hypothetical protein VK152_10920 [Paludibacter sp.]|nr:hypothetical protein [Paludibacter sp.]
MKNLFLLLGFLLFGNALPAQKSFFPSHEGAVLQYHTFDKKDKFTGSVQYTVKQIKDSGNVTDITYRVETRDAKGQPVYNDEITIHQKGDRLYMDMGNFVNKAIFKQNGEIPTSLQVEGNDMEIPANPIAGDVLPDANVEMVLKAGIVNMKMTAEVTNRKLVAIESVTVKAGTFQGYKFTSEASTSTMGIKGKYYVAEWYAKGVGLVKNETYDKNNILQTRMELVELNE